MINWHCLKLFVLGMMFAFFCGKANGQDHYCGVYSVYAVIDSYGEPVEFESLLEPDFISGYRGSSSANLVAALKKNGINASNYSGLKVSDLKIAGGPILLHVRGSQATKLYNHWVVYFGEKNGKAVILDPSMISI